MSVTKQSSRAPRRTAGIGAAFAVLVATGGCSVQPAVTEAPSSDPAPSSATWTLPPIGELPDYQLGGPYAPAAGVGIIGRDRAVDAADDLYTICYVNGFQTQPGELDLWPGEVLLRKGGETVFDADWPDEALVDTSSPDNRDRIAELVAPWIQGCAQSGFQAVEFDNLDSYTRSNGAVTLEDNLALAATLVDAAHEAGLAAGQKNAAADSAVLHEKAGFDFAVTEECAAYNECGAYTAVYGNRVIDIEYTDSLPRPFSTMCADSESPVSMVLRDRDLLTPGDAGYVFETCDV